MVDRISHTYREHRRLIWFNNAVRPALRNFVFVVQHRTPQREIDPNEHKNWDLKAYPDERQQSGTSRNQSPDDKTPSKGHTRILGGVRKLGIMSISRTTARKTLRQHRKEPAPDRVEPILDWFLKRQAATDCEIKYETRLGVLKHRLRSKLPKRLSLTPKARRNLIRFGKAVGDELRHLISIVQFRTFQNWLRAPKHRKPKKRAGKPRTKAKIRKLGIMSVSRTTTQNILKKYGIEPSPDRSESTWEQFL